MSAVLVELLIVSILFCNSAQQGSSSDQLQERFLENAPRAWRAIREARISELAEKAEGTVIVDQNGDRQQSTYTDISFSNGSLRLATHSVESNGHSFAAAMNQNYGFYLRNQGCGWEILELLERGEHPPEHFALGDSVTVLRRTNTIGMLPLINSQIVRTQELGFTFENPVEILLSDSDPIQLENFTAEESKEFGQIVSADLKNIESNEYHGQIRFLPEYGWRVLGFEHAINDDTRNELKNHFEIDGRDIELVRSERNWNSLASRCAELSATPRCLQKN